VLTRGASLTPERSKQRYSPVYEAVSPLIQTETLGEPLHGYFENDASDENLPPAHWFWDRTIAGNRRSSGTRFLACNQLFILSAIDCSSPLLSSMVLRRVRIFFGYTGGVQISTRSP
jgi:hypothetical protein